MKSPEAFRTISEVAAELDLPQHVLRFWESRFSQIRPVKRAGGRRYYRPDEIDLLRGIRSLLYGEGYTIKGVQKLLRERGQRFVIEMGRKARTRPLDAVPPDAEVLSGADPEGASPVSSAVAAPVVISAAPVEAVSPVLPLSEEARERLELLLAELLTMKQRLRAVPRPVAIAPEQPAIQADTPEAGEETDLETDQKTDSGIATAEPVEISAADDPCPAVGESLAPEGEPDKTAPKGGRGIGRRVRKDARSPRFDFGF